MLVLRLRHFLFALLWAAAAIGCSRSSSGSGVGAGLGSGPMTVTATAVGHPDFLSPHANPIVTTGGLVFVTNTPADTVDVIDATLATLVARIPVGIDPVGLAVRPDGTEVWVSNHVSDSVSVIDTDATSSTFLMVVDTVQDFDAKRATRFDEPVGIAFANDSKAYVALSSENRIAIVDVATRAVTGHLDITAQDPRALVVRGSRLYVAPFESGNQTQLSGCTPFMPGQLCTFDALANVKNIGSLNIIVDLVKNPLMPDRDLYVFDTTTDQLIETVDTLGTLLYGVAADSTGRVFIAQTDARNDANGAAGTASHGLAEMENRAFLNRVTRVDFSGGNAGPPVFANLEPLPPMNPLAGQSRATPFAIQVSADDSTLVVSAAHSQKIVTVNAATGIVMGEVATGRGPRGIALEPTAGPLARAWVLNALDNSVAVVDLSDPANPAVVDLVPLDDPRHPDVKSGRFVFEDADASSTKTFSCASCHPDGHTDQVLWVLDTPFVDGGNQIMPRATMPIRGLRGTAPYHWDGVPGDPYGGPNATNIFGSDPPNCDGTVEETCARVLVNGSLATTMKDVNDGTTNDEGLPGNMDAAARDALAKFMLAVPYPPAQRRPFTNVITPTAKTGFDDFNLVRFCGDCHRMPHWTSSNTGLANSAMEAPTWRGAYDRWLIFPQGRSNLVDVLGPSILDRGFPEKDIWLRDIGLSFRGWDMMLEGSTGFPGAFARQLTLNATTANAALTGTLLDALELAAGEEALVLQGEGAFVQGPNVTRVALEYRAGLYEYVDVDFGPAGATGTALPDGPLRRADLVAEAAAGTFVGTFTGRLGANGDLVDRLQPVLYTGKFQQGGDGFPNTHQAFPSQAPGDTAILVRGRYVEAGAFAIVDGRRVTATVACAAGGALPGCNGDNLVVDLAVLPPPGTHLLQVQNPGGLVSNECLFIVQ